MTKANNRSRATAPIVWDSIEVRDGSDQLSLRGHAAVFNERADLGSFTEQIAPGAFIYALGHSDPVLVVDHAEDSSKILARVSAGSLKVSEDERGLAFTADLVPTTYARDVALLCKTGHISQCSFAFSVAEGGDSWTRTGPKPHRLINRIDTLWDLTVTATPAYAGTDVRARKDTNLNSREATIKDIRDRLGAATRTLPVSPYGPDSPWSWFRDKLLVAQDEVRQDLRISHPEARDHDLGDASTPHPMHGGLKEAKERLAALEARALSGAAGSMGEFVTPAGSIPDYVASAFAAAARAESRLPAALGAQPLPSAGFTVSAPRLVTGGGAAIQVANGVVTSTDPTTGLAQSPVALVAGQIDISRQVLDRTEPGLDQALAIELGRALAQSVDVQILNGSGSAGSTLGLLNVSGISTTAYTSATPVQQVAWSKVMANYAAVSSALGTTPDTVLLSPTRMAWFHNWLDSANALAHLDFPPGIQNVVEVPAMPANLGAGTNEDRIVQLDSDQVILYMGSPVITVYEDLSLAANAQVRVSARQYIALLASRQPTAIGVVSGTGLVTPVVF